MTGKLPGPIACRHRVITASLPWSWATGVGFAPVRRTDHDLLVELMEGVEDIPGVALSEGLSWEWESFPDYLDYLSKRQFDMDIGAQLPHAALRVYVMGQRGADREPATAEDVVEMHRLTEQAIRSGALGFTSSRTLNHRSARGEPTPTLQAEYDELVGMASALRSTGRGVMEMISDFDDLETEFDLLKSMVSSAGRPMSISLSGISDHGWRKVLKKSGASDAGFAVNRQVAPRPGGILLGLTTTYRRLPPSSFTGSLICPWRSAPEALAMIRRARRVFWRNPPGAVCPFSADGRWPNLADERPTELQPDPKFIAPGVASDQDPCHSSDMLAKSR